MTSRSKILTPPKARLLKIQILVLGNLKVLDKHRAEFDTAAPSANYDHMCIRFLERDLKEIIKQHRFQRFQAGLPLLVPESSATGYFLHMIFLKLPGLSAQSVNDGNYYNNSGDRGATASGRGATVEELPLVVQLVEEAEAVDSQEHQAREPEQHAPEAGQVGPIPSSPTNSSFFVHSSDSIGKMKNNSDMALVKLQLAGLVNHLKEISDAKKGEGEIAKRDGCCEDLGA
ncbi:hypothetical protein F511_28323 [Dorcoceras hygrometricum]|uniref:Uncharacterized protein n=1 Tax=Dorcoceras hygrometricum TaxID=472368 RepID=A0A2Z7ASA4_9LAMI|nr:hypothetical protein F511_28323 [Dorcoceras hygrometricum]